MGEDLPRAPSGGGLATLNSPRFPYLSPDVQVYHVKLQGCSLNWFRFGVGIQLKLVIFSQLKLVIQLEGNVRSGGTPWGRIR